MDTSTITVGAGVLLAVALLMVIGLLITVTRLFRKVEQGKALIISKVRKVDVTFTGSVVLPVLNKAETMDISVKTMELERSGNDGLICQDNIRADISIKFFVRVNPTTEDVLRVAKLIGVENASSQDKLQDLFSAKFSEALKTVGKHFDFEDLYTRRAEFRDRIMEVIGQDLNGYVLDDAAIDYLEQTPKARLDADNILDAQGILKITELTKPKNERTHSLEQDEAKEKDRQRTEAMEAREELRRRREEAEAKAAREIETLKAREEAETQRVQAEERLKSQTAHIRTDEQLGVQRENQQREIAVAEKNRERVISIESERIEKDRMLEVIGRDRETELAGIAKDKEVEAEKREVAEVVRERVAVEKTVAEQEENIKKLRAVEEAERDRQAIVIHAEAEAQQNLVKDIKAAEAAEQAAKHKSAEELTLAEARQQATELDTRAKIRHAEGLQAEAAAEGLAAVQVREQDAEAVEKLGRAEAVVEREKSMATAEGVREKLKAEAEGLNEKAGAMAALDEAGRGHEEYRLRLETEKDVRLAGIDVHRQVAEAQATVLATGLEKADINIVGGDGMFFDRMVNSIGMGKAVDGFVENSDVAQSLAGSWLDGSQDFGRDLSRMLGSVGTDDVKNLTVSAVLLRLIDSGGPDADKMQELLSTARRLGVDNAPVASLDGAKANR